MRNITDETGVIYEIQRYLRALHFDTDGTIPPVNPDGIYGPETRAAVEAYQRLAGLPVTGTVELETWRRLYADYIDSVERNARPRAIFPFPEEEGYAIRPGEYSDITAIVQFILRLLADHYDEIKGAPPTGSYDAATQRDIAAFRKIHGLPEAGPLDKITWNALAGAYNRLSRRAE